MPFVTRSFLFLVVMPEATSSFLLLTSFHYCKLWTCRNTCWSDLDIYPVHHQLGSRSRWSSERLLKEVGNKGFRFEGRLSLFLSEDFTFHNHLNWSLVLGFISAQCQGALSLPSGQRDQLAPTSPKPGRRPGGLGRCSPGAATIVATRPLKTSTTTRPEGQKLSKQKTPSQPNHCLYKHVYHVKSQHVKALFCKRKEEKRKRKRELGLHL